MSKIASFAAPIQAHLQYYLDSLSGSIYEPAKYLLDNGGKRYRPSLLMTGAAMYGMAAEQVLDEAIAMEIFHNFTLLHDDVMDKADSRRGRPTVHLKWNESQAILTGDIMFSMAFDLLSRGSGHRTMEAIRLFNKTAAEVCIGQQYDMEFEERTDVSAAEYIEMIGLKTSVLLGACMSMGSILAGAAEEEVQGVYEYAFNVGLAFQMQDDLLDAFGDQAKVGKRVGGDILRNKKTILLITALDSADAADRQRLDHWFAITEESQEKVTEVKGIMQRSGAVGKVEELMSGYLDTALTAMSRLDISAEWKAELEAFAQAQLSRAH